MKNIVLIGMPACGKSSTGVILAKGMGMDFLDTDLLIQQREGDLLQNLIDQNGMNQFLRMEEAALLSIETKCTVIATGGSAVYSAAAMEHLRTSGDVIYLRLPVDILEQRLHNIHSRGIAMEPGETLFDLFQKRSELYETYADLILDTESHTVEDTVEQIIKMLL